MKVRVREILPKGFEGYEAHEQDVLLSFDLAEKDGLKYYAVDINCKRVARENVKVGHFVESDVKLIAGEIIKIYDESQKPEMSFTKADKEQRQGRENHKDAESILCELLVNSYLKEIHTPFFDLLKWAVLEFTGHNELFKLVETTSIIIVNHKGKRVLWFKGVEGSGAKWADCVETLWKIKMPYISVDYVLKNSPVVHYYNGENIGDTKEISDDFIKISKLFLEKLGGGDDSARA